MIMRKLLFGCVLVGAGFVGFQGGLAIMERGEQAGVEQPASSGDETARAAPSPAAGAPPATTSPGTPIVQVDATRPPEPGGDRMPHAGVQVGLRQDPLGHHPLQHASQQHADREVRRGHIRQQLHNFD